MRVQVRKCPFTGKLFEEKDLDKYVQHLIRIREGKRTERLYQSLRAGFNEWLAAEKEKITHVDMIVPWFEENQRKIMDATNAIRFGKVEKNHYGRIFVPEDKFADVQISKLAYSNLVSNSHSYPDNGVSNWCGQDPNLPKGYPGWKGTISGKLLRPSKYNGGYPYTEAMNLVRLKTGGGGGGNGSWSYELYIFLDDWPGLKEQVRQMEEEIILGKLKGIK